MRILSKITISHEEKQRRRIIYSIASVMLMAIFLYGFITVYVNSYNIMHEEPMIVLNFYQTSDGIAVVVFNHRYNISL